jgi:flavin-dependent dehydrogenase
MLSPEEKAVERGSLGYIFRRGFQNLSLESQLLNYVKTSVIFDRYIEIEDIKDRFDYVVVADANSISAKKLGVWTDTFTAHVRVATILGKFNPSEVIMWVNTKYVKNGFCYLVPNNSKEASLVIIINGITSYELDYYWKEFLFTENIEYYISTTTDAEHNCGFVQPLQVGNVLFTGNAAGLTDDLIGCGGLNAIESGMLAGRAIAEGKDYNILSRPIFEDIVKLHELRKTYNRLDNSQLDMMVGTLDIPILKNTLYNNPFFKMSDMHKVARLFNNLSKKRIKKAR